MHRFRFFSLLIALKYITLSGSEGVDSLCTQPIGASVIKHNGTCLWTMAGGNLSVSDHGCEKYGGSIFTFTDAKEAVYIMNILEIPTDVSVFIGAILNTLNGSLHYDWLKGPGTWSTKLEGNVTNKTEASESGQFCLIFSNGVTTHTDCAAEMELTVCERDITAMCPCEFYDLYLAPLNDDNPGLEVDFSLNETTGSDPAIVDINSDKPTQPVLIKTTSSPLTALSTTSDTSSDVTANITLMEAKPSADDSMPNGSNPKTRDYSADAPIPDSDNTGSDHSNETTAIHEPSERTDSSTGAKFDPTEKIPVHGPNGTENKTVFEVLNHVLAHAKPPDTSTVPPLSNTQDNTALVTFISTNQTTINTPSGPTRSTIMPQSPNTDSPPTIHTSSSTPLCSSVSAGESTPCSFISDAKHNHTSAANLSEILRLPDDNGTRYLSFGALIKEVVERSNITKITGETVEPAFMPSNRNQSNTKPSDKPVIPVIEMKFQVSGLNTGAINNLKLTNQNASYNVRQAIGTCVSQAVRLVRMFNFIPTFRVGGLQQGIGHAPLLIDNEKSNAKLMKNISRILKELREEKEVDNITLLVFMDTVRFAVEDKGISEETQNMKKFLFNDFMGIADHLVNSIRTPTADIQISTDVIDITSRVVTPSNYDSHDNVLQQGSDIHVTLDDAVFRNESISHVRVSTVFYKKMGSLVKASNEHIGSHVIGVSVQYVIGNVTHKTDISTDKAIVFTIRTFLEKERKENTRMCSYWNFQKVKWSTDGCAVLAKNSSHTICTCNHLTNFAILVMYTQTNDLSMASEQALFTLTTVGCSLSIACLAMALITYVYLKMLGNEKILIHANLSLALMLAQIVFVSSSDAYRSETACKVVAVLLHFLFMASFTWMMVEGIALYLCCTKGIFNHSDMRVRYFLLGWGLPVIIVVVSFAAQFPNYGNGPQYSCWLSVQNGLIWAFLGPMLVIVLFNMLVMGLVVKAFLTLKTNVQKTEVARLRGSLRAMLTLLPLLGLTWIFSLLVPFSVVFHYFFVIINTIQGMCIFFLHCICNDEIRKKFHEKRRRWSTTRTASDAEMSYPARRKTGSFDAIKAAVAGTSTSAEYARRSAWT